MPSICTNSFSLFFFFLPEANEYIICQQQDTGQMALWAMGDWDSTRAWGCDYASELIFTDADIQDGPRRPVNQAATCFAEKLDYSCSDREAMAIPNGPLKTHYTCIYKADETHVKDVFTTGYLGCVWTQFFADV